MSPIEKARAKSAALQALGLNGCAGPSEIRAAWKRAAFDTHPDRNGGSLDAFSEARAAYDLLVSTLPGSIEPEVHTAKDARRQAPSGVAMARRPKVAARTMEFPAETVARCRALFEEHDDGEDGARRASTDHVARGVRREGRCLTYVVHTPLLEGRNRVAVPTAVLEDPRKVRPRILSFRAEEAGAGEVQIPDAVCTRLFPGARSVRIRFANA